MKIVHVETGRHFYGGAQQVVWLLQGLVETGAECRLVCTPDSAIAKAASAIDIEIVPIICAGDHDVRFAWRLRRYLEQKRPDLVHCHSRRGADFLGGWAARSARIPAVLSRRVDNPEPAWLARLRYRNFRRIIAISRNIEAMLTSAGMDSECLELIRDAVDVDSISATPEQGVLRRLFGIERHHYSVAVVGQLIRRKGHRFLLDVLPGLCLRHPQIRVVVFGIGPEEERLRGLTNKLGLSAAVTFAGFRLDLDQYLAAFDAMVHPAEQEGMGVAMLKAAAAGLPVVAFDVAGAREAVLHGKTGILVPEGDLANLQASLELLLETPDMGRELGLAGKRRMITDFSVQTMVESHMQLYGRILHGRT